MEAPIDLGEHNYNKVEFGSSKYYIYEDGACFQLPVQCGFLQLLLHMQLFDLLFFRLNLNGSFLCL